MKYTPIIDFKYIYICQQNEYLSQINLIKYMYLFVLKQLILHLI